MDYSCSCKPPDLQLTPTCSYFLVSHSTPAAKLPLLPEHHLPFLSRSSTPKPINHFAILLENPGRPFLCSPPLPLCPPDGRGTDPSALERSVTSVAHLGVSRGASGRVRASPRCQGSRTCQLLRLQRAAAADAAHLQVNVFWGELCQTAGE